MRPFITCEPASASSVDWLSIPRNTSVDTRLDLCRATPLHQTADGVHPAGFLWNNARRAQLIGVAAKATFWLMLLASSARLGYQPIDFGVSDAGATSPRTLVASREHELKKLPVEPLPPTLTRQFMGSAHEAPSVHASTITRLPGGDLISAWFGGSREGGKDVSIYASNWDRQTETWEPPRVLSDRSQSSRELGRFVKKLGNPVLFCDSSGRLWLYYVTVSVGGWSGGSISVKFSDDQGRTWSDARRLIATPFLNTSNLVRSTPIELDDGGVLLPVYHEFLCQFGELLQLDANGHLVRKQRMNSGSDSLQPTLAPRSATELVALYRAGAKSPPQLRFNQSSDAGQTWSPLQPTNLANPGSSIAAIRSHSGDLLMAYNPSPSDRKQLAIGVSADGALWRQIALLEDDAEAQEFSYPSLIRGESGVYHLTYTWNRQRICHVMFNDAWLEASR
jgi:predicted neuraminidase